MKRLNRISKCIIDLKTNLGNVTDDICKVQQYQEQLADLKYDFTDVRDSLTPLDIPDEDRLTKIQLEIETGIFDVSLNIKRRLFSLSADAPTAKKNVKLPRIEVPTFNGDILNWKAFWEQFCIAVHDRKDLPDSEKLVYLRSRTVQPERL